MRSGLGPGRTWSSHQPIPDARLAATEFYNDYLRRFDYFYTAGGILFQDGPRAAAPCNCRDRATCNRCTS
jgi:hypothetical protein